MHGQRAQTLPLSRKQYTGTSTTKMGAFVLKSETFDSCQGCTTALRPLSMDKNPRWQVLLARRNAPQESPGFAVVFDTEQVGARCPCVVSSRKTLLFKQRFSGSLKNIKRENERVCSASPVLARKRVGPEPWSRLVRLLVGCTRRLVVSFQLGTLTLRSKQSWAFWDRSKGNPKNNNNNSPMLRLRVGRTVVVTAGSRSLHYR